MVAHCKQQQQPQQFSRQFHTIDNRLMNRDELQFYREAYLKEQRTLERKVDQKKRREELLKLVRVCA